MKSSQNISALATDKGLAFAGPAWYHMARAISARKRQLNLRKCSCESWTHGFDLRTTRIQSNCKSLQVLSAQTAWEVLTSPGSGKWEGSNPEQNHISHATDCIDIAEALVFAKQITWAWRSCFHRSSAGPKQITHHWAFFRFLPWLLCGKEKHAKNEVVKTAQFQTHQNVKIARTREFTCATIKGPAWHSF